MPQSERDDERNARSIVERVLKVEMEFADLTGGIDYVFTRGDRTAALEVSRITREDRRKGQEAWLKRGQSMEVPHLRNSWIVMTDGYPVYKGIWQPLSAALSQLEMHRLERYESEMKWWLRHVPTLEEVLRELDRRKVRTATSYACITTHPKDEVSKIILAPSGSWMSDGPNGTVAELNQYLTSGASEDNFRKLTLSDMSERHLWFWVDSHSLERLRDPVLDPDGHLALPSIMPDLPEHVTHLWLVDDVVNHGWLWTRDGEWSWVNR